MILKTKGMKHARCLTYALLLRFNDKIISNSVGKHHTRWSIVILFSLITAWENFPWKCLNGYVRSPRACWRKCVVIRTQIIFKECCRQQTEQATKTTGNTSLSLNPQDCFYRKCRLMVIKRKCKRRLESSSETHIAKDLIEIKSFTVFSFSVW